MAEDTRPKMSEDSPVRRGAPPPRTGVASSTAPETGKPVERELDPQQRLEALLESMRNNAKHNAPVSPAMIRELEALVAAGRGGKVAVRGADRHVFPGGQYHDNQSLTVKEGEDGKVRVLTTAEDALMYIRGLPDDVRNRPKWVVAERSLLDALDSNEPRGYQAAYTAITAAQADDDLFDAPEHDEIERLPDGRVREERFADRRLPPKPEPVPEPAPAA